MWFLYYYVLDRLQLYIISYPFLFLPQLKNSRKFTVTALYFSLKREREKTFTTTDQLDSYVRLAVNKSSQVSSKIWKRQIYIYGSRMPLGQIIARHVVKSIAGLAPVIRSTAKQTHYTLCEMKFNYYFHRFISLFLRIPCVKNSVNKFHPHKTHFTPLNLHRLSLH